MDIKDLFNEGENTDEVRQFFDQWHIFQKVIDNNYLFHREVEQVLRAFLNNHLPQPFNFADLGCGDAQVICKILRDYEVTDYAGVDLSSIALKLARKNTENLSGQKTYICDDFLSSLDQLAFRPDVIWIGLSFHHLHSADKIRFFQKAHHSLAGNGYFVIHDAVVQEGKDRDFYLDSLEHQFRTAYHKLSGEELESCVSHIRSADFPEDLATYKQWAKDAGFARVESIYTDPTELCQVLVFSK